MSDMPGGRASGAPAAAGAAEASPVSAPAPAPAGLEALLGAVGESVLHVGADGRVAGCNEVFLAEHGLAGEAVAGRRLDEVVPGLARTLAHEAFEECRRAGKAVLRVGFSAPHGRWRMVRALPLQGGVVLLANQASESMVQQYLLSRLALRDTLTGLGNKLSAEQHATARVRDGQAFFAVLLALDRLHEVNDAHGHGVGDAVLLEVASRLQSLAAEGDSLFRFGGNEFLLVGAATGEAVARRADEMLQAVCRPITHAGHRVVLRGWAGTVEHPHDGADAAGLFKRAGLALREARRAGREGAAAYRPALESAIRARAEVEAELRAALDGSQFVLHLQPKVSLRHGGVVGGEALIRWAHPSRGLLAPDRFLPVAAETGLMGAIYRWVLHEALRLQSRLLDRGQAVPLGINLSVDSLGDPVLSEQVAQALRASGTPPGLLEIEIPEGTLMRDVHVSARVLGALHSMGVRLSIDDFGTGYSSFAYLAQFPVHALKIDRSFVQGLESSQTSRAITEAIVRLGRSLSLEVVVEGAETAWQVDSLRRMQCETMQGYFAARPMPFEEFAAFVAAHRAPSALSRS